MNRVSRLGLLSLLVSAPALSQQNATATVDLYRIGRYSIAVPITVDGKVTFKLEHGRHVVLTLTPGQHQLESQIGTDKPLILVDIQPGQTQYAAIDWEHISMGKLMGLSMTGNTTAMQKGFSLTMDRLDAAPAGKYKPQDIDTSVSGQIAALPPYDDAVTVAAAPPVVPLSDIEVREAIAQGRRITSPTSIGATLEDIQRQLGSAVAGLPVSGMSVRVYSAKQWIELQAAVATREMRPFTVADVTPEMRQKLLHVLAMPSTPDRLNGQNMSLATNIVHVVLQSSAGTVQPVDMEPNTVTVDSALRSKKYMGMAASFPEPNINEPFKVVVIGDNYRKFFDVKATHLTRLR